MEDSANDFGVRMVPAGTKVYQKQNGKWVLLGKTKRAELVSPYSFRVPIEPCTDEES